MNWVSINDRKPAPDSNVFVWGNGKAGVAHVNAFPWGPNRVHLLDWSGGSHNDVTHWMLIEPPTK